MAIRVPSRAQRKLYGHVRVDAESTVLLSAASYTAYDSETYATITILRNGSVGEVSADYATEDDTATSPDNYTETTGTVSWPDGDVESRPVQIPIAGLETVIEYASDVLYPWIAGDDPRNESNIHEYRAMLPVGAAWRSTLEDALVDQETERAAQSPPDTTGYTINRTLLSWYAGGSASISGADPYNDVDPNDVSGEDRERIVLFFNKRAVANQYHVLPTWGAGNDLCTIFQPQIPQDGNWHWWSGEQDDGSIRDFGSFAGTTLPGAYFENLVETAGNPDTQAGNNIDGLGACFEGVTNSSHPSRIATWRIADEQIQVRRVPRAPVLEGSDLPDWPLLPSRFWWDSETGEIFSKEQYTQTSGSFRWLATYGFDSSGQGVVEQRPIGPVLPVGHEDDTEEFWTNAYNAAVSAGTIPSGKTYDATGNGDSSTFPRNSTYAHIRTYKLPLSFNVNLSNPVGAELIEPDSATVYILPA